MAAVSTSLKSPVHFARCNEQPLPRAGEVGPVPYLYYLHQDAIVLDIASIALSIAVRLVYACVGLRYAQPTFTI